MSRSTPRKSQRRLGLVFIYLSLIVLLLSCGQVPLASNNQSQSLNQTQMALSVQATVLAQQASQNTGATLQAQQATLIAQAAQATVLAQQANQQAQQPQAPAVDTNGTQIALWALGTQQAMQSTQVAMQATQNAQQQPSPEPATQAPPATAAPDLKTMMKSANILLYEDMAGNYDTKRYVKEALDTMGLTYVDVGGAKGRLKSNLLSSGPKGTGWDLVIIAAEVKSGVSGEFFTYVNDMLNKGTPVILEVWYLDRYAGGTAGTVLARCGVEYQRNWMWQSLDRLVMSTLNSEHPIMREPNAGLSFSRVTDYWEFTDVGDLIQKTTGGDATLLIGTMGTEKTNHGTLAVCADEHLILQTFCTHSYDESTMVHLWQNYIYHELKVKFLGSGS